MLIATTCSEVRAQVAAWKKEGLTVGLVPTMGYLHEAMPAWWRKRSASATGWWCPTLSTPPSLAPMRTWRPIPGISAGTALFWRPTAAIWCFIPLWRRCTRPTRRPMWKCYLRCPNSCAARPAPSISGACAPWWPSYSILSPRTKAFFGQKDAQQLAILRRMVRDLSYGITLVGCPIVREPDGLAKSSRNTYLSKEERRAALVLSQAVALGEDLVASGETDARSIVTAMTDHIAAEPLARVDYVSAVDGETMEPVDQIREGVLVALAVYIGKTRLIDNFLVEGR